MLVINFELWVMLETHRKSNKSANTEPAGAQAHSSLQSRNSLPLSFSPSRSLLGAERAGVYQKHLWVLPHGRLKLSLKDLLGSKSKQLCEAEKLKKLKMWLALLIRSGHWGNHTLLITALCRPISWGDRIRKQIETEFFVISPLNIPSCLEHTDKASTWETHQGSQIGFIRPEALQS